MKQRYLLDTNVLVHVLRNKYSVLDKIRQVGWSNCYISEFTVAELLLGAELSKQKEENTKTVNDLVSSFKIIPFSIHLKEYCKQKAELQQKGCLIEDFDLFIGTASIVSQMTIVTENISHLSRLSGIKIENWVERV
ncbi:MAG: PIN domain-containing protein [Bacteroidales bacterium]|nr:PIN domain-containing protein [Candidatus Scybalocola fimicaballi]